jgi:hypothetical protein
VTNKVSRFFKAPFYDRDVVQYAEDSKQPCGVLEGLTIGTTNISSPAFTGPVMVNFSTPRSLKSIFNLLLWVMRLWPPKIPALFTASIK